MLDFSLQNNIALVTGATRGIGRGIAQALGAQGATVIGTATTQVGADKISEDLNSQHIQGQGMVLNVTDPQSVEQAVSHIKKAYGAVQILVNNAAITKDNLILRLKEEEWMQVIDTDLNAIYRVTKACIRDMIKAHFGRIINIGSVVGSTGNPGQASYCAAKAGMIGLTKSLAQEVGSRDITVNVIAPGYIQTDMTNILTEEQKESIFQRIPVRRVGTVQDIASTAVFLASQQAAYITGQTIHVNGGMYMD